MKATFYSLTLLAIAALWFACGYTWATNSTEPEYIQVPVDVMVSVERQWDETMLLGVDPDLNVVELAKDYDPSLYLYIVEVNYNVDGGYSDITIFMDLQEGYASLGISVASGDYAVKVTKGTATMPIGSEPAPVDPSEATDEF